MNRADKLMAALSARPWRRAVCWLAFLAPFFYLTYGAANFITAQRHDVGSIVFAWERHIPFLAWTIIPYWSINAFYGASFFMCATRRELDTHAWRLLTAQVVAVTCFILFPLRFTFEQPQTQGIAGFLFAALTSFDQPFNQAPSLHIALLTILWYLYAHHLPPLARWPLHLWFTLVGASVLTTYQHHFFDIPTGVLLGTLCLWLWPDSACSPLSAATFVRERPHWLLAAGYLAAGAAVAMLALLLGGAGLWLLWPSLSLALVAASYAVFGPGGFQKQPNGRMSFAARLLLAPYLAGAFINSRWWTRHDRKPAPVGDRLFLGRIPSARETAVFATVVDLAAELPGGVEPAVWISIPMLDLVAPSAERLREAAMRIDEARAQGTVLVCCALGYSRSAAAVVTWLVASGRSSDASEAIEVIRRAQPRVVIGAPLRAAIEAALERPP